MTRSLTLGTSITVLDEIFFKSSRVLISGIWKRLSHMCDKCLNYCVKVAFLSLSSIQFFPSLDELPFICFNKDTDKRSWHTRNKFIDDGAIDKILNGDICRFVILCICGNKQSIRFREWVANVPKTALLIA